MGRREDRAALQASGIVLEPRVPGVPFSRKDLEDAETRASAPPASGAIVDVAGWSPSRRTYLPALAKVAR